VVTEVSKVILVSMGRTSPTSAHTLEEGEGRKEKRGRNKASDIVGVDNQPVKLTRCEAIKTGDQRLPYCA